MNKLENSEDFLNDLSGGGLPDGFAEQAARLACQAARSRVRARRVVHGGLATAAMVGAVSLLWPREVERPIPPMVQAPVEPKTEGLEIRSVPFGNVIRSESLPPEVIVASASGGFAVVETAPEKNYAEYV